jgi:hypothetical protein
VAILPDGGGGCLAASFSSCSRAAALDTVDNRRRAAPIAERCAEGWRRLSSTAAAVHMCRATRVCTDQLHTHAHARTHTHTTAQGVFLKTPDVLRAARTNRSHVVVDATNPKVHSAVSKYDTLRDICGPYIATLQHLWKHPHPHPHPHTPTDLRAHPPAHESSPSTYFR